MMSIKKIEELRAEHEALFLKEHLTADDRFRLAWLSETLQHYANQAQYVRSYLGVRFQNRTFETFNEAENSQAKKICMDYSKHYKDIERNGLLLVGAYGTGKTHLAAAIANDLIDRGIPLMFDTFSGYLERLKTEFGEKDRYCLKNMCETPVLFIDDIGKEKQSEWSESVLYEIINTRYEAMLPIVITSNVDGRELEKMLGGATYSRLCEMCRKVNVRGEDKRKEKK